MLLRQALLCSAALLAACATTSTTDARSSKRSTSTGITNPATMNHTTVTTGGGTGGSGSIAAPFATPTLTRTSTTGTNPPTWDALMPDLQAGDTEQLDFTSNGSAPDGTAEESHTAVSTEEAVSWSTFTGFAGGSTVKWTMRYGRTIAGTPLWSNWASVLTDVMAAPAFTPASLYGTTDIGYAWNPTVLSNLKQNINGTTSVAFNDRVGFVTDLSGKGNNLAGGANDTTRPTVVSTNNGMLAFAGGQRLSGIGGFYAKGAMTWVGVVQGANNANFIWAATSTSGINPVYSPGLRGSGASGFVLNYLRNDANTATANSMSAALFNSTAHVYVVEDTGSVVSVSVDGGAWVTNSYTRSGSLSENSSHMGIAWLGGTTSFGALTGNIGAGLVISRILTGSTPGSAGTELNSAYNWVATQNGLPTL